MDILDFGGEWDRMCRLIPVGFQFGLIFGINFGIMVLWIVIRWMVILTYVDCRRKLCEEGWCDVQLRKVVRILRVSVIVILQDTL